MGSHFCDLRLKLALCSRVEDCKCGEGHEEPPANGKNKGGADTILSAGCYQSCSLSRRRRSAVGESNRGASVAVVIKASADTPGTRLSHLEYLSVLVDDSVVDDEAAKIEAKTNGELVSACEEQHKGEGTLKIRHCSVTTASAGIKGSFLAI